MCDCVFIFEYMYVWMCVYVWMCMYVWVCVYVSVCVSVRMWEYVCVALCVCVNMNVWAWVYAYECVYACMYARGHLRCCSLGTVHLVVCFSWRLVFVCRPEKSGKCPLLQLLAYSFEKGSLPKLGAQFSGLDWKPGCSLLPHLMELKLRACLLCRCQDLNFRPYHCIARVVTIDPSLWNQIMSQGSSKVASQPQGPLPHLPQC